MNDKNFLVVKLGGNESGAVHIEAQISKKGRATVTISSVSDPNRNLFKWTVGEDEVENLQNLFICLRNELGRLRLESSLNELGVNGANSGDEQR